MPLGSIEDFTEDLRTAAAAESYLRRCLEGLLDLGRHILAKAFGRAPAEYKAIVTDLEKVDVLSADEAELFMLMAGYRNRMVHFYHEISQIELYQICTEHLEDVDVVLNAFKVWIREHPECVDTEL